MSDQYKGVHWTAIQKMVQAAGGEWTNVKEGIAYLEAQKIPDLQTKAELPEDEKLDADAKTPVEKASMTWDDQGEPAAKPHPVKAETTGKDIRAHGFNPDAPYGTVHGVDTKGAAYHQNGKYYGYDGQVVGV